MWWVKAFFATSSRKIKNHVVESHITLLVWPSLNHLQKNIAQGNFNFAEVILGIPKKYVSENKIYFCSRKKSDVLFNNYFCLSHNFQAWFYNADVLSTDVCVPISYFFCSLISVSKKWNLETILTFPWSYNWKKFKQPQNEWKKKPGISQHGPDYVTGQINSRILELLLRRFCCLIFALSQKS